MKNVKPNLSYLFSFFFFLFFPSYNQMASLLMLVWVKRCIFCVEDMENQSVINRVFMLNDLQRSSESLLHVCVNYASTRANPNSCFFYCSCTGCTNWNVLRCLAACPRKCGHSHKGKEIRHIMCIILSAGNMKCYSYKYCKYLYHCSTGTHPN